MLKGRDLIMIFDRFVGPKKGSGVAQDARVQVRTPDGRHYDLKGVDLVENKIFRFPRNSSNCYFYPRRSGSYGQT